MKHVDVVSHGDIKGDFANGLELAKQIKQKAIGMKVGEEVRDIRSSVENNEQIELLKKDDTNTNSLFIARHTASHIFAQALLRKYPEAKLAIGPAIAEGFYYDFDFGDKPFEQEHLDEIEKEMKKIIKEDIPISVIHLSYEEAKEFYKGNRYKLELIEGLHQKGNKEFQFYEQKEFKDLCKGPHVLRTGGLSIKLQKISGAYWRGKNSEAQLVRVYGVAFFSGNALMDHLQLLKEIIKRDHRTIGKQLKLFTFSEEIGKGLPIWLPKGNIIKEEVEKWAKETEMKHGYQRVTTPLITKENLFYTSEHLPHYEDTMYAPIDIEGEKYYIKPMNCPFHHKIFETLQPSYKDLPLRLTEYGWCHRYEQSGALHGLLRVRGMCMNDAHIYCSVEQVVEEFINVIKLHQYYYELLGIKEYFMELALRDPNNDKYHGEDEMWEQAEKLMREAMDKSGVPYVVENDGAAFYGPKIDFQIKAITGKVFTASTNQIDLFMPMKFNLSFVNKEGKKERPVVIHRAPLGTHERFIGFLIEHFEGKFPLWLAPVQIKLLTVADRHVEYANKVKEKLMQKGFRVETNYGDMTFSNKVRLARNERVNYMVIIGDQDLKDGVISVRDRVNHETAQYGVDEFISMLEEERDKKIIK